MCIDSYFKLKKPCANCPFRKEGAIELREGRLEGIIQGLIEDDQSSFHCHKIVHNERTGGEWSEEGEYQASGRESMCAGAMIYLEKAGRPTVGMRLGQAFGLYNPDNLAQAFPEVIEPIRNRAGHGT